MKWKKLNNLFIQFWKYFLIYRPETNYFEIEILDRGLGGVHNISIGVVNLQFPLDTHIGRAHDSESIAYHTGEGALYHNGPRGQSFGDRCEIGDKIGKFRVNIK